MNASHLPKPLRQAPGRAGAASAIAELKHRSHEAASLLKALANPDRLMVLCLVAPLPSMQVDIGWFGIIAAGLLVGVLFGAGWGIAGFCPGPAVVAASTGSAEALAFVAAMLLGMTLHDRLRATSRKGWGPQPAPPAAST